MSFTGAPTTQTHVYEDNSGENHCRVSYQYVNTFAGFFLLFFLSGLEFKGAVSFYAKHFMSLGKNL